MQLPAATFVPAVKVQRDSPSSRNVRDAVVPLWRVMAVARSSPRLSGAPANLATAARAAATAGCKCRAGVETECRRDGAGDAEVLLRPHAFLHLQLRPDPLSSVSIITFA